MRKSQLYSIAFGFSLLVLLSFSLLLYNSITQLRENSSLVEHSQVILDKLQKLNIAMMDVETSQRGYLLTNDTSFLDLLMHSRNEIPFLLDSLNLLVGDNPEQKQNAVALRTSIVQRLQRVQEVLNRVRYVRGPALTLELNEGKKMMDEFRANISSVSRQEQMLMKTRTRDKEAYERLTPNYFKAILTITTIIALISFILLLQELRERLKAQAQLETRVNILAQTNAELQQIAHVTSHDLQEPLRKIRTFIDALRSKFSAELPEEAGAMLIRIDKNAGYIRELVADLSDFANLAGKDEDRVGDIDINHLLLQTQKDLEAKIRESGAKISISPLPRIGGYPKQLAILFEELLTNAVKFSKPGTPPDITVTGTLISSNQLPVDVKFRDRNFSIISVYDNGIGFDQVYANKIFILFQKLNTNDGSNKGKGIGLAVCQKIMANHDGFITASSAEGRGATLSLYFPLGDGE